MKMKPTFRIITVIICVLAVLICLGSCEYSIEYIYGIYNGALVLDIGESSYAQSTWETIDDYVFYNPTTDRVDVWYKGELYTLTEGYENGILSIEDIEKIHKKHTKRYDCAIEETNGWMSEFEDKWMELLELNARLSYIQYYSELTEEERAIVDVYNNGNMGKRGCISVFYCKLENGAVAVDMSTMGSHAGASITKMTIEDLTFAFSNTAGGIEVLYDGEFCSLTEAYEMGIVSYEDLLKVHAIHLDKNPHLASYMQ